MNKIKLYSSDRLGKVTVPENFVTKTVGGYEFALEAGQRYRASRPFADRWRKYYPVSITRITPDGERADPDVVVPDLTYDEANALLDAFNNGVTSFEGRVW